MSTQESRSSPMRYVRNNRRRKAYLGITVDLNVPPPSEGTDLVDPFMDFGFGNGQGGQSGGFVPPAPTYLPPAPINLPPAPIDIEAIDDDVVISSPTAFAEAKNNSRRTRARTLVVDLESDDRSTLNASNRSKRRRGPSSQTIIICDSSADNDAMLYELGSALLGLRGLDRETVPAVAAPPPPPPPPEPTFSCPVCMGQLVEEMSTKCGHIFCKKCIKAAITAQTKCPTCRRKCTMKDIIRVYLPTTN